MVQYSNSSKIMEAENNVKHDESSKNRKTKKGFWVEKVLIPIAVAVVAGLLIWLITKNNNSDYIRNWINIKKSNNVNININE